jgi:hypothetical protein
MGSAAFRAGSVASQIFSFFRISANLFSIYPTPTSTRTIAYQYIGKNWIYPTGRGRSPTAEYFAGILSWMRLTRSLLGTVMIVNSEPICGWWGSSNLP